MDEGNVEQQKQRFVALFKRLSRHHMPVWRRFFEFFGHSVDAHGMLLSQEITLSIKDFFLLRIVKTLRIFLGLRHAKKTDIYLSEDAQRIFELIKSSLAEVTILAHSDSDADLYLVNDASCWAVNSATYLVFDEIPQPHSYYSRKLVQTEQVYSTFSHEF
ncbi:unnamed protein product [Protopolystoma xenopodis]|uniref:Reverse transcriptase/retrotransposon-derived protein RNase H-like domain-containing protein n=1 Tax=Protopolystoma xenopodis TaxID=117903 RepID=A0A448XNG6_9PLAT|nr:unnamed protein product [Protopolystoma xenopodis]